MPVDDTRFARRWAARRVTNGLDAPPALDQPTEPVLLTASMALLSDYEDAIYASSRHSLYGGQQTQMSEAAHLVEATRLHADVRRLRLEILDLMNLSTPDSQLEANDKNT